VQNVEAIRYRPIGKLVGDAMGLLDSAVTGRECAVAFGVDRRQPRPALVWLAYTDLRPEPLGDGRALLNDRRI
jgi:hypothetical protein